MHRSRFDKFRNDRWVFGNRAGADERGSVPHLVKFSWTTIVRHQMVTGTASPDDPDLAGYRIARRHRARPPLDSYNLRLLTRQDGRCPLCKGHLLSPEQPPPFTPTRRPPSSMPCLAINVRILRAAPSVI